MQYSVVVPCFNEIDNIAKLREEFFPVMAGLAQEGQAVTATDACVEVIFVDDGSTDGTLGALQDDFGRLDLPGVVVRFERHVVNRGLGAALRTGFAAAQGDIVITTDSDGTYRFEEIPGLLACLAPGVGIVTASPYHPQGGVANVPGYRLVLSRGSSLLYRVLVDRRIHTYTALFRAYRKEVVKQVPFASDGFLAGTELMVNAILGGCRAAEYPTVLHSRVHGASKAKILRTIRAHLEYQGRLVLHRLGLSPISLSYCSIGEMK